MAIFFAKKRDEADRLLALPTFSSLAEIVKCRRSATRRVTCPDTELTYRKLLQPFSIAFKTLNVFCVWCEIENIFFQAARFASPFVKKLKVNAPTRKHNTPRGAALTG